MTCRILGNLVYLILAEDRLADRLATAAKDKLGQVNREKQLANQEIQQANREKQLANQEQEQADREKHIQAERKRKAAMFLSRLKDTSAPEQATSGMYRRESYPENMQEMMII